MSATAEVAVPGAFPIDRWLAVGPGRSVLDPSPVPAPRVDRGPVADLGRLSDHLGFEWEWDLTERLLSARTSVNAGLDEMFGPLAATLRHFRWGYRFTSYGTGADYPGQWWEWMPGWPVPRMFIHAHNDKAIPRDGIAAVAAAARGRDLGEVLAEWFAPWRAAAPSD